MTIDNSDQHNEAQSTAIEAQSLKQEVNEGINRRQLLGRGVAASACAMAAIGMTNAVASLEAKTANHFRYPPYRSKEAAEAAYAAHVSTGHKEMLGPLPFNIHYGKRQGARVQDAYTKRWYWDCHRNGSKFNLGHCHPEVTGAMQEAMGHINAGSFLQLSGYRAKLAEKLVASTQGKLTGVTFGVGGACAVEIAIHAARRHTKRRGLVAIAATSYHGATDLTLSISGMSQEHRDLYEIDTPHTTWVPFNDLAAMKKAVSNETAAVVMEPSPAQAGFPKPDSEYLKGVKKICEERGAVLILDEIQTGLGGTGPMWTYQHYGFTPDILVTGKGLGGGLYPISAAIMEKSVWHSYSDNQFLPHESTYAGAELGCIVAAKVIDITTKPAFLSRVKKISERFAKGFANAPFTFNQMGLCMGIHTDNPVATASKITEAGVLVVPSFVAPVVPFRPILTLTDPEIDNIIERIIGALT